MAVEISAIERSLFVNAELNYFVPTKDKPYSYTFDPSPGVPETNVSYQAHPVVIHNARPIASELSLDVQGFQLLAHATAVKNFNDEDALQRIYYPETASVLRQVTGSDRVLVFDHTIRRHVKGAPDRVAGLPRQPVPRVHNDYTVKSGPQRVRDLLPEEAGTLLQRRFSIVNVWRPILGPLQDHPLALCDARTVQPQDFVALNLIYPDRIGEVYTVNFAERHRWYYAPEMQNDEVMLIKTYDSAADGTARFTAHAAFADPTAPLHPLPRASIELRALVFY